MNLKLNIRAWGSFNHPLEKKLTQPPSSVDTGQPVIQDLFRSFCPYLFCSFCPFTSRLWKLQKENWMVCRKQGGKSKMKMRKNSNQVSGVYRPSLQRTQEQTQPHNHPDPSILELTWIRSKPFASPQARDHLAVFLTDWPKQVSSVTSPAHPQYQVHSTEFATWFAPFYPTTLQNFHFPEKSHC